MKVRIDYIHSVVVEVPDYDLEWDDETLQSYIPVGATIESWQTYTIEETEQEVHSLITGEVFTGRHNGVEYQIELTWGEDWSVTMDLISFAPCSPSTSFWLSTISDRRIEETLYDALYTLPEVKAFQARIDACRNLDSELLDRVIERIETNA